MTGPVKDTIGAIVGKSSGTNLAVRDRGCTLQRLSDGGMVGRRYVMRDSRLVGVVADHDSRNAVVHLVSVVRLLACVHFPRKRIRVYAAIHEEPLLIPFLRYGGGSVHRNVEAEKRPVGGIVWVGRSETSVLWSRHPGWRRQSHFCNGFGVEAPDQVLVFIAEYLEHFGRDENLDGHITASVPLPLQWSARCGLILTSELMLGHCEVVRVGDK